MAALSNLTTNQHYVWQHYLRAWATQKKLWCKRIDADEPFATTPRNIGAERFFYEFHELTPDDIAYLNLVISQSNDDRLRTLNQGWIDSFQKTFSIRRTLIGMELEPAHLAQLEMELQAIEKTLGESFHSATESRAVPLLDALRREDASFYENEETSTIFIDYISHQYFRTARMRRTILAIPNPLPHDMSRTWPVEAFIYATNLASSFVKQRRQCRIVLLQNKSSVPFITGDQPIINLCGYEVEKVDLYYPLKPDLAMIFTTDRTQFSSDSIEVGRIAVESYNHRIYAKSYSQIYGNDPVYLKALVQLPKEEW